MRTISVAVSESDYAAFQEAARTAGRPVAELIREAMAAYREARIATRTALREVPVLLGHRPVRSLPARTELYDEVFARERTGGAESARRTRAPAPGGRRSGQR